MALVLAKRTSEDAIQVKVQVTEYSMYVPPSLVVPAAAPFPSSSPEYRVLNSYKPTGGRYRRSWRGFRWLRWLGFMAEGRILVMSTWYMSWYVSCVLRFYCAFFFCSSSLPLVELFLHWMFVLIFFFFLGPLVSF